MRILFALAMSLTAVALSSSGIEASLSTSVHVLACAQDLAFQDCEQAFGETSASIGAFRSGAAGTASGAAIAGFGALGASGVMTASVSSADGGVNASGSVEATAAFSDVLNLFALPGHVIAPGTPITLRATLELHDAISISGPGDGGRAVARLFLHTLELRIEDAEPGGASPPDKRASADIVVAFGTPIALSSDLFIGGIVSCVHSAPCTGGGAINAFDTALSNVDVVTPGVGYTTDSGATYVTPTAVPWPSTLLILGPGLLYLARRHRSR